MGANIAKAKGLVGEWPTTTTPLSPAMIMRAITSMSTLAMIMIAILATEAAGPEDMICNRIMQMVQVGQFERLEYREAPVVMKMGEWYEQWGALKDNLGIAAKNSRRMWKSFDEGSWQEPAFVLPERNIHIITEQHSRITAAAACAETHTQLFVPEVGASLVEILVALEAKGVVEVPFIARLISGGVYNVQGSFLVAQTDSTRFKDEQLDNNEGRVKSGSSTTEAFPAVIKKITQGDNLTFEIQALDKVGADKVGAVVCQSPGFYGKTGIKQEKYYEDVLLLFAEAAENAISGITRLQGMRDPIRPNEVGTRLDVRTLEPTPNFSDLSEEVEGLIHVSTWTRGHASPEYLMDLAHELRRFMTLFQYANGRFEFVITEANKATLRDVLGLEADAFVDPEIWFKLEGSNNHTKQVQGVITARVSTSVVKIYRMYGHNVDGRRITAKYMLRNFPSAHGEVGNNLAIKEDVLRSSKCAYAEGMSERTFCTVPEYIGTQDQRNCATRLLAEDDDAFDICESKAYMAPTCFNFSCEVGKRGVCAFPEDTTVDFQCSSGRGGDYLFTEGLYEIESGCAIRLGSEYLLGKDARSNAINMPDPLEVKSDATIIIVFGVIGSIMLTASAGFTAAVCCWIRIGGYRFLHRPRRISGDSNRVENQMVEVTSRQTYEYSPGVGTGRRGYDSTDERQGRHPREDGIYTIPLAKETPVGLSYAPSAPELRESKTGP